MILLSFTWVSVIFVYWSDLSYYQQYCHLCCKVSRQGVWRKCSNSFFLKVWTKCRCNKYKALPWQDWFWSHSCWRHRSCRSHCTLTLGRTLESLLPGHEILHPNLFVKMLIYTWLTHINHEFLHGVTKFTGRWTLIVFVVFC